MTTHEILVWIIESALQKIEQGLTQNTERINITPSDMVQVSKKLLGTFLTYDKKADHLCL
jgi:hypothetical protein